MSVAVDDLFAIQSLLARYSLAMDARDGDGFAALFAEDAVFTVNDQVGLPSPLRGRTAIRDAIMLWLARLDEQGRDWVRHVCGTPLLDCAGGVWTARVPFLSVHHDTSGGGARPVISRTGVYSDHIVRSEGRWVFARRRLDWDNVAPRA